MTEENSGFSSLPQQAVYYEVAREDVAPFVPPSARAVLDIGCSRGGFGPTLRRLLGPDARIVGIEPVASQAETARVGHDYDEVLDGYFPDALEGRDDVFDAVFFNDVLEHVYDPWALLERVHRRLAPGGQVVAAIPNVQVAGNVIGLVKGHWDYADHGILDRTHVRFFTRSTMLEMFTRSGYVVESCSGANPPQVEGSIKARLARRLLLSVAPDARYLHFVIVARSMEER